MLLDKPATNQRNEALHKAHPNLENEFYQVKIAMKGGDSRPISLHKINGWPVKTEYENIKNINLVRKYYI